jgi:hypothetical protein
MRVTCWTYDSGTARRSDKYYGSLFVERIGVVANKWTMSLEGDDYTVYEDESGKIIMTDTTYYPVAPDYETVVKLVRLWNLACGVVNGD